MNLCVEQKADVDKAGKVQLWFARNCEHGINVGVSDCWFLWEP